MQRVVVVGGGLAAVRTAQSLRRHGFDGELVLLSAEDRLPYDRPPLSKEVLRGDVPEPPLLLDAGELEALRVDLRVGTRAVSLDATAREVLVDDGSTLGYDALVVASGAQPRHLPDVAGPGAHVLRTADDAAVLAADVRRAGRLTVVGGGLVGCEVAASARELGADVVLVEQLPLPLLAALGEPVAAELAAVHRAHGVDVRAGTSVLGVSGEGADRVLHLSDGADVPGDPVLVAVGVEPDAGWLAGSGVEVDGGVVCDAGGRTSVEAVLAVGDVARWLVPSLGAHRRVEHWTSAQEQADVVARVLLGEDVALDPVPYVWTEQYGVTYQLHGFVSADDDVELHRVDGSRLLALWHRDGRLTAVLGAGVPRRVARARKALRAGAPLEQARAAALA